MLPDLKPKSGRILFGDQVFSDLFRTVRNYLIHEGCNSVFELIETGDRLLITIAALWRIQIFPETGKVLTHEKCVLTGEWLPTTKFDGWPTIYLLPVAFTKNVNGMQFVSRIVDKVVRELLHKIPGLQDPAYYGSTSLIQLVQDRLKKSMHKRCGGDVRFDSALKALRATIFKHLLDHRLTSIAQSISTTYPRIALVSYLEVAIQKDVYLRVAKEQRNLLPLVGACKSTWRDDIFSERWWVRGKGRGAKKILGFSSPFESPALWRWVRRQPITVVRELVCLNIICESRNRKVHHKIINDNPKILQKSGVMAAQAILSCGFQKKLPAIVLQDFIRDVFHLMDIHRIPTGRILVFTRAWLDYFADLWRDLGYSSIGSYLRYLRGREVENFVWNERYLTSDSINDLMDYLRQDDAAGLKLGISLAGIARHSTEWHKSCYLRRLAERGIDAEKAWKDPVTWEDPSTEVRFEEIVTPREIEEEGSLMGHCVASYMENCQKNHYRVFRVIHPTERYTLGVYKDRERFVFHQIRGRFNDSMDSTSPVAVALRAFEGKGFCHG